MGLLIGITLFRTGLIMSEKVHDSFFFCKPFICFTNLLNYLQFMNLLAK